jgi:hypothetical protein
MNNLHCPDCGRKTLRLIEETDPDLGGEYNTYRRHEGEKQAG